MGKVLKWSSIWCFGLLTMVAGIGSVENPDNNLLIGASVTYLGCFIFVVATINMIRTER